MESRGRGGAGLDGVHRGQVYSTSCSFVVRSAAASACASCLAAATAAASSAAAASRAASSSAARVVSAASWRAVSSAAARDWSSARTAAMACRHPVVNGVHGAWMGRVVNEEW